MRREYFKPESFLLDEEINMTILSPISGVQYEGSEKGQGTTGGDTPSGEGGGGPGARGGYSFFEDDDF